jgi:hypothetical protein
MNVKAIRMNALERMEKSASKRKPAMRSAETLVGHKQTTAQKLLEREETNARRSRMESLLTQQFIGKYGSKAPSSRINSFIKATVHDFVNSYTNMNVAESMVESLEGQIREITDNMKNEITSVRTESRQQEMLKRQQEKLQLKLNQQANRSNQGSRRPSGQAQVDANGDLIEPSWAVLNAISAAEAEVKEQQKKQDAVKRAQQYKVELDKQRDYLRSLNNKGDADKQEQHVLNVRAAAEHEADQLRKLEMKKIKGKQEMSMRQMQIEANKMQREKERQLKIMAEKADMTRSRRLAESEAHQIEVSKQKAKLANEKVMAENEENKRIKGIAKQKQWDYEAKLNKDYEAKLEREEKARVDAFEARVAALKKFESSGATIAEEKKQAETDEMEKTMAAIEAKYEKEAQRQKDKDRKRKEDMKQSRDFNITLIERKKRIKEEERKTDAARRQTQQKELEDEKIREMQKKQAKLAAANDLKKKLDDQVNQRHQLQSFQKNSSLSSEEIEYNRKIIKKLESDPRLMQEVLARVKPTPRGGMGDFKYG